MNHAIADFTKAVELNPKDVLAYSNRGSAYSVKGQFDQAIDDYTKAIELNPKYAIAYNDRGSAYASKGFLENAITDFDKSIELNPLDSTTYSNRGNAFKDKGQLDKAITDYTKAIELNPKDGTPYYGIACIHSLNKNVEESCKWLQKSVRNGFNDWEYLKRDVNLNNIRDTSCYKKIIVGK